MGKNIMNNFNELNFYQKCTIESCLIWVFQNAEYDDYLDEYVIPGTDFEMDVEQFNILNSVFKKFDFYKLYK